ncbi:MAG: hypothetical protein FWG12_06280, partial [Holophagaceae bacterium]|nr:hypothetical protein [Holophagaceae bacterium]
NPVNFGSSLEDIKLTSSTVKYDGKDGSSTPADLTFVDVTLEDLDDGATVLTWTNSASTKIGTTGVNIPAGTLKTDAINEIEIEKTALYAPPHLATVKAASIFPNLTRLASTLAAPEFNWTYIPANSYTLEWDVTDAGGGFSDLVGSEVIYIKDRFSTTSSGEFISPKIDFDHRWWNPGEWFEVEVKLVSPFGTNPESKPVKFKVTIK